MKKPLWWFVLLTTGLMNASKTKKSSEDDGLAKYLARVQMAQPPPPTLSLGSLWVDSGPMASLGSDYKAKTTGDVITIAVLQGVTSSNNSPVAPARPPN